MPCLICPVKMTGLFLSIKTRKVLTSIQRERKEASLDLRVSDSPNRLDECHFSLLLDLCT